MDALKTTPPSPTLSIYIERKRNKNKARLIYIEMKSEEDSSTCLTLFESKPGRARVAYRILTLTQLAGILLTWVYRLGHVPRPGQPGRAAWLFMFAAEVLLSLYWTTTQAARWRVVYRRPFRDRLAAPSYKDRLPAVDIFVCTADPTLEPPLLVINTVLSVMSYNHPPEKLSVYLSDDGCSELTFYALLEASKFSEHWIPFCKQYNAEPRAPEVYFAKTMVDEHGLSDFTQEWTRIKDLYEEMKSRIDSVLEKKGVPRNQHRGFKKWDSWITKQDHQSIVQILIDGWNARARDADGGRLPTLVYLSREKRPGWKHNFKAGAMNSLIRVSSNITNAPVILNLDCDMYANDPEAIRDAMCFFLDEKQGKQISYVQYPQRFTNITKNDIYANVARPTFQVELSGIDGFGGALYIGTGCFHRRDSLSGKSYPIEHNLEHQTVIPNYQTLEELEAISEPLASCSYENGTLWGKEVGLVYGFPVEDIVTGLTIQCRGWKPVYYNPRKNAFEGIAPTTLDISLIQFKRWSEGMFQIFWSKYCPFVYGHGKISLGAQMGYCVYLLWAPLSLPFLCYVVIPTLYLLRGVSLYPEASSAWFLPFAYIYVARIVCSLVEDLMCGDTLKGWWNLQRMTYLRRVAPYLFAFLDTVYKQIGLSETSFVVTDKALDDSLRKRYEEEIMEFGSSSIMFVVIASIALLNLIGLAYGVAKASVALMPQIVMSGIIVAMNVPVYAALFIRRDSGRLPLSVLLKSMALIFLILYAIQVF